MSNHKNRELKGAEIRQLAEMCANHLRMIDPHGFGLCWRSNAETVNKVAEVLGIPWRISDGWDTRIGPRLVKVG
jgi:hypothetical protein